MWTEILRRPEQKLRVGPHAHLINQKSSVNFDRILSASGLRQKIPVRSSLLQIRRFNESKLFESFEPFLTIFCILNLLDLQNSLRKGNGKLF